MNSNFPFFYFSEDDFEKLPSTPIPELLRCNLSTAALQILAMGITNISTFDFLSKPDEKSITAALRELTYLRAIQASNSDDNVFELTNDGRKMACFPLDPKFDLTKKKF
jgi:HrpA-like RNA helicase